MANFVCQLCGVKRYPVSESCCRVQLFVTPWTYSLCNSPGKNTGVGSLSLLQGIFPTQGSNLGLPHCGQILLLAEPQGKPKNSGVGSLSLLQRIFPTQESNRGLLHYRRIRYPLSYQGRSSCICPRYCQFILPAPSPTASTSSLSAPVSVSLSCIRTVLGTLLLHWHF